MIIVVVADTASNIKYGTRQDSQSLNVSHKKTWTLLASALLQREYLQTNSGF